MIPLTINTVPVSITLARLGDFLIVDPNSEEESIMDARMTYTINDKDCFCAGQKGQPGTLTIDQVKKAAEIAKNKAREIREIIRRCISKDA